MARLAIGVRSENIQETSYVPFGDKEFDPDSFPHSPHIRAPDIQAVIDEKRYLSSFPLPSYSFLLSPSSSPFSFPLLSSPLIYCFCISAALPPEETEFLNTIAATIEQISFSSPSPLSLPSPPLPSSPLLSSPLLSSPLLSSPLLSSPLLSSPLLSSPLLSSPLLSSPLL